MLLSLSSVPKLSEQDSLLRSAPRVVPSGSNYYSDIFWLLPGRLRNYALLFVLSFSLPYAERKAGGIRSSKSYSLPYAER